MFSNPDLCIGGTKIPFPLAVFLLGRNVDWAAGRAVIPWDPVILFLSILMVN
jgi:hypothetical protein